MLRVTFVRAKAILFALSGYAASATQTTTATARKKRTSHLFEVAREIGFLAIYPLAISLHDNSRVLSSFVKTTLEERGLPIEDKRVRRIQQSESGAVKGCRRSGFFPCVARAFDYPPQCKGGHPD